MIFIVGGAGYIGSHVNKLLSNEGYKTLILDNLSKGHEEFVKWGKFIKGDLKDKRLLARIFKEYDINAVMHFAALTDVRESIQDPGSYYKNNVKNTLNLLDAMRENVKKFIFSSTCAVYGNPLEIPITEDHPCNPISPYGRSKLMIENILEDYSRAYDFNYVSLRYFNAAGADPQTEIGEWHEPETHLIPIILDAAIGKRENVQIFGTDYPTPDGTCIRDYIHVMDLANAHYKALRLLEEDKSEIFNLGNGNGFSVKEIIETCKEITGEKIHTIESKKRPGDPPILIGSSKKAKRILRWRPEFADIKDIIETAWEWHQKLNRETI
ncbi:UDP-glucose 4-epimerase GalE [Methanothermobacter tenebrarum]|jgi:UDP-glucose 4-epimerase|uniref:UDP-glucose 4-epimerase GalE n=1 Tax=Methanothermobacter tenebrarum TaxID=680118 RepID=A0ABN6PEZ4_9EURY|nr:UDP-glucose 4-epimerase GalE [Methanothermobacter tenebrarum]MDD3454414.1 UDP-glucose 4-epimerase GalE [Methanobacteriales archaeon]MDX9692545.1 UDP-glucose 4-epimerase GalE [Methanothermobacter sp.]BDH79293.1 UDP-glucose 4-epimerase GalE [Methanothermobacter tenebrarum]HOQ20275.1 UDP-glucose 4-epimerase GalE [Methanothermobacter sp.]